MMQGEKMKNIITQSDSYKIGSHFKMYSKDTTYIYSYLEAREGAKYNSTIFMSLQYILKKYFIGKVVTQEGINKAKKLMDAHIGPNSFNIEGWQYILDNYDGKLPLLIKAVPEGSNVPVGNVLMTVENTCKKSAWLTNYVESILSHVWYGSTVATLSYEIKKMMLSYLSVTSDNPEETINFMLHDFGYRGASSVESAEVASGSHLLSFMSTDTVPALEYLIDYYNADVSGFSVPATEHSVMTRLGKDGEFFVLENLFDEYPTGILSVVIDSYNWKNFIKKCGTTYKDTILNRDGKFVFRPDSGDPIKVTIEALQMLDYYFGSTLNNKGYKVLNNKIGYLWGDGIDKLGIEKVIKAAINIGFSADNLIFGMGGALHSKVNRDTQCFAFKSSYQVCDGVGIAIYKDPIDGTKRSKKGKLALIIENGEYKTIQKFNSTKDNIDLLVPVFKNGELLVDMALNEVKKNL
jgi:nicotinamide phosphoribosyltransferase